MSIYRLPKRPPASGLSWDSTDTRDSLRPLMGQEVLVVGGQGTSVPGSLADLRTANAAGERIPIGHGAFVFPLDNERMREEGLRLYANQAKTILDHVNIGYDRDREIFDNLPNIRQLHHRQEDYGAGRGMPLAATGYVAPYRNSPKRMGVEETQKAFGAQYIYSQLNRLQERLATGELNPGRFNELASMMIDVAKNMDDEAMMLYDLPKRNIDTITAAVSKLASQGVAHQARLVAPGGFRLPEGIIPFTPANFVKPGASPSARAPQPTKYTRSEARQRYLDNRY